VAARTTSPELAKSAKSRALARAARRIAVENPDAPLSEWSAAQRTAVAAYAGTIAVEAMAAAQELTARTLRAELAKDAAQWSVAARNLAVVAGIHIDKAQLLSNQPTARTERVDEAELRERLARLLGMPAPIELPASDPL
jgi:hypothetical protein